MEVANWVEMGGLRGWRPALVRVVVEVREVSYFSCMGGFAAKN
jgi:hypothetical protein